MLNINGNNYNRYIKIYEVLSQLLRETESEDCENIIGLSHEDLKKDHTNLRNAIDAYERSFNILLMSLEPNTYYEIKFDGLKEYIRIVSIDQSKDECVTETIRITKGGNLISNLMSSEYYTSDEYSKATRLCSKLKRGTVTEIDESDWDSLVDIVNSIKQKMNIIYK